MCIHQPGILIALAPCYIFVFIKRGIESLSVDNHHIDGIIRSKAADSRLIPAIIDKVACLFLILRHEMFFHNGK